jgi:hypothetical protein
MYGVVWFYTRMCTEHVIVWNWKMLFIYTDIIICNNSHLTGTETLTENNSVRGVEPGKCEYEEIVISL